MGTGPQKKSPGAKQASTKRTDAARDAHAMVHGIARAAEVPSWKREDRALLDAAAPAGRERRVEWPPGDPRANDSSTSSC